MALRSGNPTLNAKTFEKFGAGVAGETMSVEGAINKSGFLLFLLVTAAAWPWWGFFLSGGTADMTAYVLGGALGGFAVALLTIFNKPLARVTAPIYALLEGLALGALSALMELRYPGIVMQAVALTFGTLAAMLVLYRMGVIRASERFKAIVCAATGAIGLFYIVALGLRFIGIPVPLIHEASTIGILFSLFVVTVAALNLIIDFDFIEGGVEAGAPKVAEWYAAFALMVTLVWLYLEILRLLSKLRRR